MLDLENLLGKRLSIRWKSMYETFKHMPRIVPSIYPQRFCMLLNERTAKSYRRRGNACEDLSLNQNVPRV